MLMLAFAAAALLAVPVAAQESPSTVAMVTKLSADQVASDPRMAAAIRHANLTADHKCGEGVGGTVSLEVKAAAQACRRRMVSAAKADAEYEINPH